MQILCTPSYALESDPEEPNADIAREFGLAQCTVKKLVSSILAKVGASSRTEAASLALRLQLVKV